MGVNIFVEGYPSPVIVSVKLKRDVSGFRDLKEITDALVTIESVFRTQWPRTWPRFERRANKSVHLLQFKVLSPPEFQIFTDPAWIAVFVSVLVGYGSLKDSAEELGKDLNTLLSSIRGLTRRELELLHIAATLSIERMLEVGEKGANQLAKKIQKARHKLLGKEDELPEIKVVDIRDEDRRDKSTYGWED